VEKQSQIVLDSQGFFASRLALERPPREVGMIPAAEMTAHLRHADLTKRSQISPIFVGFFATGLAPEASRRRASAMPEATDERIGSFSWQILK
jgi:hypothetical protein